MSTDTSIRLGRRAALVAIGSGAGGVVLAACGNSSPAARSTAAGSPTPTATRTPSKVSATTNPRPGSAVGSSTTPLKPPGILTEAPQLAAQVKAGKLPKLTDRLPDEPYVIPHNWVQRGHYGGMLTMNITSTSDDSSIGEWFYAYSPLRYLNDSRTIGPGTVTKWRSNADASRWEFTLRKGLKWSDGHAVTTADVLFWWNDMANDDAYSAEGVPDDCKSGKGTICKLTAKDDRTWVMQFDAPAPLTADRLATWSNGYGGNGPSWIIPSHYVKQFHPKYNPKVPKDWASPGGLWERKASYRRNPACPTLASFRLSKYVDGRTLTWERNPFYCAITRDGDQLPYIDGIVMTAVQDPQVGKLQVIQGKVDIAYGQFVGITLSDVSTLNKTATANGIQVLLWDTGTGSAGAFFLNQDYYEQKYRELFREPKFRQALSHGFDRNQARTAVYFNTGGITTGTMSPKAIEFNIDDEGKKTYTAWQNSYVEFNQGKAKKLLDAIGVVDKNGDGKRELSDGSKLELRIALQANASDEYKQVCNQLARDWTNLGVATVVDPQPPDSFDDTWNAGKYMAHSNRAGGDGPNCLVYPQWMVPVENNLWAPLQGQMYASIGTKAYTSERNVDPWKRHPPRLMPVKGSPVARMWSLYNQTKVEPDMMRRTHLVWRIVKIHVQEGPFFQGTVANSPQIVVIKDGLMNVPTRDNLFLHGFTSPWTHPTPAVYDPETFFWDDPTAHKL